jgi:hypothetical protein
LVKNCRRFIADLFKAWLIFWQIDSSNDFCHSKFFAISFKSEGERLKFGLWKSKNLQGDARGSVFGEIYQKTYDPKKRYKIKSQAHFWKTTYSLPTWY